MRYSNSPTQIFNLHRSYPSAPCTESTTGTCESTEFGAETPRFHPVSLSFGKYPPSGIAGFGSRAMDTGLWMYTRYCRIGFSNWFFNLPLAVFQAVTVRSGNKPELSCQLGHDAAYHTLATFPISVYALYRTFRRHYLSDSLETMASNAPKCTEMRRIIRCYSLVNLISELHLRSPISG